MKIERTRGDTYADVFTIVNMETRLPANIDGCSFKLTVDATSNPSDVSTQIYQIPGNITSAGEGIVSFAPTAQQANLVGYYYYDVEMTDSYGQVFTLVKGLYAYFQDITK